MKKAKITLYPNSAKKSKRTGLIPIYLRISKEGIKTEIRLDIELHEDELDSWNPFTERLDLKNNNVNKRIEEIQYDFEGLAHRFKSEFAFFTPLDIKEKIFGTQSEKHPELIKLLDYAEEYYEKVVLLNNNISKGTKKNYRKSINHLIRYLDHIKQSKIILRNFSPIFAFEFYDYLQKEIVPERKNEEIKFALKDYSASSIIIKISVIFSRAVDTDLISKNPFKKIKLQRKYPKKPHLEIHEIISLIELNLSNSTKLEVYRDIFVFALFTGLPYGDIYAMKKSNIHEEKQELIYSGRRQKTDESIRQILIDPAVDLIKKYENHIECIAAERIFPLRHLNNMNENLKLIQAHAGINKTLTTHIARHTTNQMLNDIGSINADVINYMLGWSNSKQGMRMNYKSTSFDVLLYAKNQFQNFIYNEILNPKTTANVIR